jgi:tRNA (cytosine40_48-C5)-methyltransferase
MICMDFLRRYKDMGESFSLDDVKYRKSFRINTLKISEKDLLKRFRSRDILLEKVDFLKDGYFYEADFSLASTPEYLQGFFYLQDASSQVPVEILSPEPGELVLDMAASPGGKCSHIAQLMNNKGVIFALEENKSRIQSLINNLERLSVTIVSVFKKDSRFSHDFKLLFDKILLDAPCGGNFCVEKDYFKKRTPQDLIVKSRVQKELLRSAYLSLKKGGVLVYSTCSLEPEENESVLDWFLSEFKDMSLEPINLNVGTPGITEFNNLKLNEDLRFAKRFWPHKTGTDGFFVARLKKDGVA